MFHRARPILRSSWITDLTRSDSPSRAAVAHRGEQLDACVPKSGTNPNRPPAPRSPPHQRPQNRLALRKDTLQSSPRGSVPAEGWVSPWESNTHALKALKAHEGLGRRRSVRLRALPWVMRTHPQSRALPPPGRTEPFSRLH